jgi:hypothetical protein
MLKATFNINSGYFIKCCMHTYMISLSIPNYPSWRSSEAYHTQEKVRNLYTLGKPLNSNIVDKDFCISLHCYHFDQSHITIS